MTGLARGMIRLVADLPAGFLDCDHDRLDAGSAEGVGAVEGIVRQFRHVPVHFFQPRAEAGCPAGLAEAEAVGHDGDQPAAGLDVVESLPDVGHVRALLERRVHQHAVVLAAVAVPGGEVAADHGVALGDEDLGKRVPQFHGIEVRVRESLLDAVADGADAGRGFEDRLAVVHVGRGEHHVDHRVGRGEEAFDVHVAEFVDHPLDFQLAGLVGFGLLLVGGLGVVGQGADGFGFGAAVDPLRPVHVVAVVAVADHDSLAGGDLQEAVFRGNEAGEGGGAVAGNQISTKGQSKCRSSTVRRCPLRHRSDRPRTLPPRPERVWLTPTQFQSVIWPESVVRSGVAVAHLGETQLEHVRYWAKVHRFAHPSNELRLAESFSLERPHTVKPRVSQKPIFLSGIDGLRPYAPPISGPTVRRATATAAPGTPDGRAPEPMVFRRVSSRPDDYRKKPVPRSRGAVSRTRPWDSWILGRARSESSGRQGILRTAKRRPLFSAGLRLAAQRQTTPEFVARRRAPAALQAAIFDDGDLPLRVQLRRRPLRLQGIGATARWPR